MSSFHGPPIVARARVDSALIRKVRRYLSRWDSPLSQRFFVVWCIRERTLSSVLVGPGVYIRVCACERASERASSLREMLCGFSHRAGRARDFLTSSSPALPHISEYSYVTLAHGVPNVLSHASPARAAEMNWTELSSESVGGRMNTRRDASIKRNARQTRERDSHDGEKRGLAERPVSARLPPVKAAAGRGRSALSRRRLSEKADQLCRYLGTNGELMSRNSRLARMSSGDATWGSGLSSALRKKWLKQVCSFGAARNKHNAWIFFCGGEKVDGTYDFWRLFDDVWRIFVNFYNYVQLHIQKLL